MDKEQNRPTLKLVKTYIKDLSFENPNAPKIFLKQDQKHKIDLNLELSNQQIDQDHWEIIIHIYLEVIDVKDGESTLFIIDLEYAGIFLLKNIPKEHMERAIIVDAPSLLFPYARQLVSQISTDGGFLPFMLEPINFMALYEQKKMQSSDVPVQ